MKKLFTLVFLVAFCFSFSQAQVYHKGLNTLHLGIGPGLAGIYGTMDVPAISLGYQAGVHEKFSVGGIIGYSSSSYNGIYWNGNDLVRGDWTYTYFFIGARGEYHFVDLDVKDFDLYAGLTLGYNIVSVSNPSGIVNYSGYGVYTAKGSYFLYGIHAGGEYFFSDKIGGFLELGYGVGYIILGVTFKL